MDEKELMQEFFKFKENQIKTDQLFEMIRKIEVRLQTLNERTKNHTLRIKDLEKGK